MPDRILIIDDDVTLSRLLAMDLQPKGFEVLSASHGREGLKLAYEKHPDLVILDVMMPEVDGWQTCQRLRELSDIPIILLTAKSKEEDVVNGFRLGADDYIRKPFSLKELEERIRAVLRRVKPAQRQSPSSYDDGALRVDLERQQVWRRDVAVHLTPTEFRLLSALIRHKGAVVSHENLLAEVWGPTYSDATACLSLYIRYLREKLEDDARQPKYILTKWGVGYRFATTDEPGR